MSYRVAVVGGDGIGPEVVAQGLRTIEAAGVAPELMRQALLASDGTHSLLWSFERGEFDEASQVLDRAAELAETLDLAEIPRVVEIETVTTLPYSGSSSDCSLRDTAISEKHDTSTACRKAGRGVS